MKYGQPLNQEALKTLASEGRFFRCSICDDILNPYITHESLDVPPFLRLERHHCFQELEPGSDYKPYLEVLDVNTYLDRYHFR